MTTALLALSILAHQGPELEWHSVSYSPKGEYLLAARRKMAQVWESKTGKPLLIIEGRDYIDGAAFTADGKSVLIAGRDKMLRKIDLTKVDPTQAEPTVYKILFPDTGALGPEKRGWIMEMALSSDGRKAALAVTGQILIVDTATGQTLQAIVPGDGSGSLHFLKGDTQLLATAFNKLVVYDLNATPASELFSATTGTSGSAGGLSPSGNYYALGDQKLTVGVVDLAKRQMHHGLTVPKECWVNIMGWARNEKAYFVGGSLGDVWIVNFPSGKIARTFQVEGRVGGFGVHPDGKTIAVAASYVLQYDWTTGKALGR